jgi:hypothetical protein
MKTFLKWITSLLAAPSYGQRLEAFIVSKNPTNTADVEHWANTFNRGVQKGIM